MPTDCDPEILLAHSAPHDGVPGDPYRRHTICVRRGATNRARALLRYAGNPPQQFLKAVAAAAAFHDLGKVGDQNQGALRKGRGQGLPVDHIDAGVAHCLACGDEMAAWLIRAHHAPGLPSSPEEAARGFRGTIPPLRGKRSRSTECGFHDNLVRLTDKNLRAYLRRHNAACGNQVCVESGEPVHGLAMRLALSCLVDADHSDTAFFDTGRPPPDPPQPRWAERLDALRRYVRDLPFGETDAERDRNRRRTAFFDACLNATITEPMVACEGPVGLGKTTAVAAYLIRRARDEGLRRLIVVAPYTNILTQTAARLRKALVLPGERSDRVIVEHHHRAEFEHEDDRDLAVLWQAPIVLTTAVSFFETLAACDPASLRKLHSVPGSAVFLDEAHAALPTRLWPQNWLWLRELAEKWGCRFVFASGSLVRFWENDDIVKESLKLPELLRRDQAKDVLTAERQRIQYVPASAGHVLNVCGLIGLARKAPGPRLVILNTVQNAAVVAKAMRDADIDVLHLSTALTPRDRDRILARVMQRLRRRQEDWSLVATSCVEAGVDLSFRCAFRERFSTASVIQTGGRVNRNAEYDVDGGGLVYDFALDGEGITQHPAATVSADVLHRLLVADELNCGKPADIVTKAMREELSIRGGFDTDPLVNAESARNYPKVKELGRVIDADTRLVVVDSRVKKRLAQRRPVGFRTLLRGSVQLWAAKIDKLGLEPLFGRGDMYVWNDAYDPDFLGYMAGVLRNVEFLAAGGAVI